MIEKKTYIKRTSLNMILFLKIEVYFGQSEYRMTFVTKMANQSE